MAEEILLTTKQAEYVREAHHRWNFAIGAVRSGKSHLAVRYTIPRGLTERAGRSGTNMIIGATRENIERNVLEPMRDIWGEDLVGDINTRNWATLFGEKVYCLGGENVRQVNRLRGSEVKFCYCDEICNIHPAVFEMLKSRLSLPYSECHAAANPEGPTHFIKQFIDRGVADPDIDLWVQHYTLWDNPFLPPAYVRGLEAEYRGTVYYDRYVLGLWAKAEGLIYPMWAEAVSKDQPDPTRIRDPRSLALSVDYGTQNAFAALLWVRHEGRWHAVREYYYSGRVEGHQKTDDDYVQDLVGLCSDLVEGQIPCVVDPSATSFITALRRSGRFRVRHADNDVANGIRDCAVCLQRGYVSISDDLGNLKREFTGYVWDDNEQFDRPVKVDDHLMDAMRYFIRTFRVYRVEEKYSSPFADQSARRKVK